VQLFANTAAVAIHNARLYERIQTMAVETERMRISREMHDGLAQVLSYVNTKAQAVSEYLRSDNPREAEKQVKELVDAAKSAYRDVREGILALRAQIGPGQTLKDVLEEYVEEYRNQLGKPVTVEWQVDPGDLRLTPLQEVQILRIAQEALTNVRKHSAATQVTITFQASNIDDLLVTVADNGKGFNPQSIQRGDWPHLGIQTMQERTEAIGGTSVRLLAPRTVLATDGRSGQ